MNHFTVLHQIAIEQHNDRLREAARAGLVKEISRRNRPARSIRPMVFLIRYTQDAIHALGELFLSRSATRKAVTVLKWLAVVLLLALLWSDGWLTPVAQAQLNQVSCTNGVGSVTDLIESIKFTNLNPNEDTLVLGQDCVYTLSSRFDGSLNGLPVIQNDLIIEGNGATIRRRVAKTATFRLFEVANGRHLTLRNLTLQSGRLTDDRGGAILTGSGTPLTLEKVTFVGNSALEGGAIFAAGPITARDSTFTSNTASEGGGGLFTMAPLTLTQTAFINNKAARGGGLYSSGGVSVTGGRFENNRALSNDGGGILIETNEITLIDTEIIGNTAADSGGGLFILEADGAINRSRLANNHALNDDGGGVLIGPGALVITDTIISGNTAATLGGGIATADGANVTMTGGQIARNSAGLRGGGLEVEGKLTLISTAVLSNTAQSTGGGIVADTAVVEDSRFENNKAIIENGGGLHVNDLILKHTSLISNSASMSEGGAVFSRRVALEGNIFIKNEALLGAGLFLVTIDDNNQVINNLWVNNSATIGSNKRSIITLLTGGDGPLGQIQIQHNTIASSTSVDATAIKVSGIRVATLHNNIITNYTIGVAVSELKSGGATRKLEQEVSSDHNLYFGNTTNESGNIAGSSNFEVDPRFVDPANGDFHLRSDSPARDNGLDVGVTVDLDGAARPFGDGFDIGAFEFGAAPSDGSDPADPDPGKDFTVYLPLVLK